MNEQVTSKITLIVKISGREFLGDFITLRCCIPKVKNISHKKHEHARQELQRREFLQVLEKMCSEVTSFQMWLTICRLVRELIRSS